MRVIFDATPLQTGHRYRGVGTYTRELLRALRDIDRQNEYRLIVHGGDRRSINRGVRPGRCASLGPDIKASEDLLLALPENFRVVWLPRPPLGRLTGFASHQLLLPTLLTRERADLFHSPGFVAAFSVPGVPWRCPLPLVVTLHDFIPLHVPELFNDKPINRWWYGRQMALAGRASLLICVSEATRRDALRYMDVAPAQCAVVHEGVDSRTFSPQSEGHLSQVPPFILCVGGDFPNKNRAASLQAFVRLTTATKLPHHLVLVGQDTTPDGELVQQYPGLDMGRVRRLAHVSQADLAQLYRTADVLLFPSTCEGFGLPVLEAMASGTPVITSTVSALPEVAGNAALTVDPWDVDAMAAALGRVLADPALKQRLRQAGLARSKAFTWERMARETLALYQEVAARNG